MLRTAFKFYIQEQRSAGSGFSYLGLPYIHSLVFNLEGRAWQEPEPSHVTGMALAHCILGRFWGVVCHCFSPPLDVPTLAARCLRPKTREILAAKGGTVGEKDVR